jgi:hypothetical protein
VGTLQPTATSSPTAPTVSLGGRGFTLLSDPNPPVQATWTDGTLESGYRGVRGDLATGAVDWFPAANGVLPHDASGFVDAHPVDRACYAVHVLGGAPPGTLATSDVLCTYRRVAQGNPPANFRIRLDQSATATLSWDPPGGHSGYTMRIIPANGSAIVERELPSDQTQLAHDTAGHVLCFVLATHGIVSQTQALCASPSAHRGLASGSSPAGPPSAR